MNPIIEHVKNLIKKGQRFDGRALDQFRDLVIETNVSETAEGSARVKLGDSEVIAGIKLGMEKPFPDRPNEGGLMVNVELLPLSNKTFEPGPPSINAIELARVTDRGIRESHAIDLKSLCVEPGEKCWTVIVDLCTINADGNLFDACGLAALAAIRSAKFPGFDGKVVDYKTKTDKSIPLAHLPLPITVHQISGKLLCDPNWDEEKASEARLTTTITEEGNICSLQKGGDGGLTVDEIITMTEMSLTAGNAFRGKLNG